MPSIRAFTNNWHDKKFDKFDDVFADSEETETEPKADQSTELRVEVDPRHGRRHSNILSGHLVMADNDYRLGCLAWFSQLFKVFQTILSGHTFWRTLFLALSLQIEQ